ncbi:uncharacterized protein VP01_1213g7 [Puccinia sorghi]|uniref:Retrotransposon gag domain-containing protein n=1 Tax=Puccinia sorghi TaxID=27349 RepID=A0A0L6VRQ6_9BASI|nr:uncharacterized protein VP01_1213g7 [Puccinia sorghi]
MVLAKPQPFNGTRGAPAEAFVGQIGHPERFPTDTSKVVFVGKIGHPEHFPTNASKVVFAFLFTKDYAATWSQPYLDKVFNGELVVFNNFLNNLRSSFFDHNRWYHVEVALGNLCQTGTVSAYMQDFNQQTPTVGWTNTPLMSLYQHGVERKLSQ